MHQHRSLLLNPIHHRSPKPLHSTRDCQNSRDNRRTPARFRLHYARPTRIQRLDRPRAQSPSRNIHRCEPPSGLLQTRIHPPKYPRAPDTYCNIRRRQPLPGAIEREPAMVLNRPALRRRRPLRPRYLRSQLLDVRLQPADAALDALQQQLQFVVVQLQPGQNLVDAAQAATRSGRAKLYYWPPLLRGACRNIRTRSIFHRVVVLNDSQSGLARSLLQSVRGVPASAREVSVQGFVDRGHRGVALGKPAADALGHGAPNLLFADPVSHALERLHERPEVHRKVAVAVELLQKSGDVRPRTDLDTVHVEDP